MTPSVIGVLEVWAMAPLKIWDKCRKRLLCAPYWRFLELCKAPTAEISLAVTRPKLSRQTLPARRRPSLFDGKLVSGDGVVALAGFKTRTELG